MATCWIQQVPSFSYRTRRLCQHSKLLNRFCSAINCSRFITRRRNWTISPRSLALVASTCSSSAHLLAALLMSRRRLNIAQTVWSRLLCSMYTSSSIIRIRARSSRRRHKKCHRTPPTGRHRIYSSPTSYTISQTRRMFKCFYLRLIISTCNSRII